MPNKKKHSHKKKHGFALALSFGLMVFSGRSFGQDAASKPTAAPSSNQVLRSINPYKKKGKAVAIKDLVKSVVQTKNSAI